MPQVKVISKIKLFTPTGTVELDLAPYGETAFVTTGVVCGMPSIEISNETFRTKIIGLPFQVDTVGDNS